MRRREFFALVTPSVLVMGGLLVLPLYRTLEWSLQKVNYGVPGEFVGLDNYARALSDPRLGQAVLFTVGLTAAVVVGIIVLGYGLAVLVNGLGRAKPWVLGVLLVSYVIPHVVGAVMFSWLFDANFGGVVNYLISAVSGQEILWFTDPWPNRVLVALNTLWFMLPFAMLVIIAGLQGVPGELIEAAEIDGATGWGTHWHVIIPASAGCSGSSPSSRSWTCCGPTTSSSRCPRRRSRSATSRSCSTSSTSRSRTAASSSAWAAR